MPANRNNDAYEVPIPKWVRIYAFGGLLLAMVALAIASFYIRISRVTPVSVVKDQAGYFISTTISDFEAIRGLDSVEFRESTMGAKALLVLQSKNYSFDGTNMRIPVTVTNMDSRLDEVREYKGFVVIENSTLMSKLIRR